MSPALWVLAGTVILLSVLGGMIALAVRLGRALEQTDDAEEDRDASVEIGERLVMPLPTQEERARAARRRLRERGARVPDDAS